MLWQPPELSAPHHLCRNETLAHVQPNNESIQSEPLMRQEENLAISTASIFAKVEFTILLVRVLQYTTEWTFRSACLFLLIYSRQNLPSEHETFLKC